MIFDVVIGIDPGVNTGIAVRNGASIIDVRTTDILTAMDMVQSYSKLGRRLVFIEDPNKRTWFGSSGRERLQGAGSIKRDFSIWVQFFTTHQIPYVGIAPADVAKLEDRFIKIYWEGRTSKHSRDAIVLALKNERLYETTLLGQG